MSKVTLARTVLILNNDTLNDSALNLLMLEMLLFVHFVHCQCELVSEEAPSCIYWIVTPVLVPFLCEFEKFHLISLFCCLFTKMPL